jgi:PAS domain S-box-containing protein
MSTQDPVNILVVDDQPANLLSYEAILSELGENVIKVGSPRKALEHLLKLEVAVVVTDVEMPEMDGFELAAMIRQHPRYRNTAIIFLSATLTDDRDRLRGYKAGAVDYITAPVMAELLRARVKFAVDLYRKTQQLEQLNAELEQRVAERTAELADSKRQLQVVADHAPVLLAQYDPRLRYKFVNRPYADFFRSRPPDILGRHPRQVLGERAFAQARPYMEKALAGQRVEYDLDLANTPHGPRTLHVASAPEFDASGRAVGLVAAKLDITERKRAEAALRESEAQYRDLFTSIDQGFCIIEVIFDEAGKAVDYRFLDTNRVFEQQTGIKSAQGRLMRQIAPDHEEHWFEIYGRVARSGEPVRFQQSAAALGRYYDVYAFRVGRPEENRVAILFSDITKRK